MEDPTSGGDAALLAKLKALARRGAFLQRSPLGADILSTTGHRRPGSRGMSQVELDQALATGLIRSSGPGQFLLTRRGAAVVRKACAQSAVAAARSAPRATVPVDKQRGYSTPTVERPGVNVHESSLSWLRQRKDRDGNPLISAIEFDAGEQLRADFWFAQMTPRVTSSWSAVPGDGQRRLAPGTGKDIADGVIAARERVNRALAAVGPELSGLLIDVCCHLKGLEHAERGAGLPQRSGKVVLQLALRSLARHYGLDRRAEQRSRHWGSPGFRPEIRADAEDAGQCHGRT